MAHCVYSIDMKVRRAVCTFPNCHWQYDQALPSLPIWAAAPSAECIYAIDAMVEHQADEHRRVHTGSAEVEIRTVLKA